MHIDFKKNTSQFDFSLLLLLLYSLSLYACGASHIPSSSPSYYEAEKRSYAQPKSEMSGGGYANANEVSSISQMPSMMSQPAAPMQMQQKELSYQQQPTQLQIDPPKPSVSKIIYQGLITLRVKQLRETLDIAVKKIEDKGGFVESMGSRTVILRVPVAYFDQCFQELLKLGLVVNKSINAIDVTEQYSDLEAHLKLSKDSRERLIKLLENTTELSQRLAIIAEIKRLTDEIEQMSASLEAFKHHLSYSTITLELIPYFEGKTIDHRSPFAWVRGLQPSIKSLNSDQKDFEFTLPHQFVKFEKKVEFEAISAKGASLRISKVDNHPLGDLSFWVKAIEYELIGRGDKIVQQLNLENQDKQPISVTLYSSAELNPYYYAIGILLKGNSLAVIEVYFPQLEAKDQHLPDILTALKSLRLK